LTTGAVRGVANERGVWAVANADVVASIDVALSGWVNPLAATALDVSGAWVLWVDVSIVSHLALLATLAESRAIILSNIGHDHHITRLAALATAEDTSGSENGVAVGDGSVGAVGALASAELGLSDVADHLTAGTRVGCCSSNRNSEDKGLLVLARLASVIERVGNRRGTGRRRVPHPLVNPRNFRDGGEGKGGTIVAVASGGDLPKSSDVGVQDHFCDPVGARRGGVVSAESNGTVERLLGGVLTRGKERRGIGCSIFGLCEIPSWVYLPCWVVGGDLHAIDDNIE